MKFSTNDLPDSRKSKGFYPLNGEQIYNSFFYWLNIVWNQNKIFKATLIYLCKIFMNIACFKTTSTLRWHLYNFFLHNLLLILNISFTSKADERVCLSTNPQFSVFTQILFMNNFKFIACHNLTYITNLKNRPISKKQILWFIRKLS